MEKNVTFKNWNWNMSGCLFLPDNFDETKQYAAITICHPGGGVNNSNSL